MKTKLVYLMAVGTALTLIGSGCKHAPQKVVHIPGRTGERGPSDLNNGNPIENGDRLKNTDTTGTSPQPDPSLLANYKHDPDFFKSDTVYFAYDSSAIKSSEQSKVANVASHLKSNPS